MMEKFSNIPKEEDTRILSRGQVKLGAWDAVREVWSWDGVRAESLVLTDEDVATVTDGELVQALRDSQLLKPDSEVTIARGRGGYTFINFNFRVS